MLTLITTPIGNLADMSPRSINAIEEADLLACEDTRHTQKLLMLLGIKTSAQLISYHDHNGEVMRPRILNALKKGLKVGLLSDAGTPLISDPGYKLVRDVQEAGYLITATAGACSPILALILSGLPTDRFLFHGFMPDKHKAACKMLDEIAHIAVTSIFFLSPSHLLSHLELIKTQWGERDVALVRELTKLHEEVIRCPISDLISSLSDKPRPKGEFVLVVGPPAKISAFNDDDIAVLLTKRMAELSVKDAVAEVASLTGKPRKHVYQMALSLRQSG